MIMRKHRSFIYAITFLLLFSSYSYSMEIPDFTEILGVIEDTWVLKVTEIVTTWVKDRMQKEFHRQTIEKALIQDLKPKYIFYTSLIERGIGGGKGTGLAWELGMTNTELFKIAVIEPRLKVGIGTELVRWVVGENNYNYLGFSGIMPIYLFFMPVCSIDKNVVKFSKDGNERYAYRTSVKPSYLYFGISRWVNTHMIDFGICHYIFQYLNVKIGYISSYYPLDDREFTNIYLNANLVVGSGWKERF